MKELENKKEDSDKKRMANYIGSDYCFIHKISLMAKQGVDIANIVGRYTSRNYFVGNYS